MQPITQSLRNGSSLVIREAEVEDAAALLDYVEQVSGESDFLCFGPGEFGLTLAQEEEYLRKLRQTEDHLCLLGLVDRRIVGTLAFSTNRRARLRHAGEFGITVCQSHWGLGIGSYLLDTLLDWARTIESIKKINLRVRTDNDRAIRLYASKGFLIEGTIRKDVFVKGQYFDHHWMGLEV